RDTGPQAARGSAVPAVNARGDPIRDVLVHVEDAFLLRPAWPFVHRAGEEVRLRLGEIDVDHAERLCAVDERQDTTFARRATECGDRKDVARIAAHVCDGN